MSPKSASIVGTPPRRESSHSVAIRWSVRTTRLPREFSWSLLSIRSEESNTNCLKTIRSRTKKSAAAPIENPYLRRKEFFIVCAKLKKFGIKNDPLPKGEGHLHIISYGSSGDY